MKRVVIVGGGFAGLSCARKLASHPDIRITLIDKNNFQQFQPFRAKIETFVEWGWDYFGKAHADPVLDRTSQANINWNADEEEQEQPGSKNEG
jgi:glycine/D-amino acid oxidase-like deaminating enzyme